MKRITAIGLVLVLCLAALAGCAGLRGDFSLSSSSVTLTVGEDFTVTATSNGGSVPGIVWTSDNSSVASVVDGKITANSVGSTVVKAKDELGNEKTCVVTVNSVDVKEIKLNKGSAELEIGKNTELTAEVLPKEATDVHFSWSSDNTSVAVVNSSGLVTGVRAGVATITCSCGENASATCTVTVKEDPTEPRTQAPTEAPEEASAVQNINNYYFIYVDGAWVLKDPSLPGGHLNPNYKPRYDDFMNDFIFPFSSVEKLTTSEIQTRLSQLKNRTSVSDGNLQDAINEIYARNGYPFKKTGNIRSYYEAKPWYYANSSFNIDTDCNEIERYNIKLLASLR